MAAYLTKSKPIYLLHHPPTNPMPTGLSCQDKWTKCIPRAKLRSHKISLRGGTNWIIIRNPAESTDGTCETYDPSISQSIISFACQKHPLGSFQVAFRETFVETTVKSKKWAKHTWDLQHPTCQYAKMASLLIFKVPIQGNIIRRRNNIASIGFQQQHIHYQMQRLQTTRQI